MGSAALALGPHGLPAPLARFSGFRLPHRGLFRVNITPRPDNLAQRQHGLSPSSAEVSTHVVYELRSDAQGAKQPRRAHQGSVRPSGAPPGTLSRPAPALSSWRRFLASGYRPERATIAPHPGCTALLIGPEPTKLAGLEHSPLRAAEACPDLVIRSVEREQMRGLQRSRGVHPEVNQLPEGDPVHLFRKPLVGAKRAVRRCLDVDHR
jgi:hypothetical protein